MLRRSGTLRATTLAVLWLSSAVALAATESPSRPQYRLHATVALSAPQIQGTVTVEFTNSSRRPLHEAVVVLFANRFSVPDEAINDFNRPFVYPEQEFAPGSTEIFDVLDADRATVPESIHQVGVPEGTFVRVPIAPLPPGATRSLTLRFRTVVPHRFGSFGEFEQQLTLVGGWYPYLAALNADGSWQLDAPPPLADFTVELSLPAHLELILNGRQFVGEQVPMTTTVSSVHYLSLVAAPELLRSEVITEDTRIVFVHRPPRRARRDTFGPSMTEITMATLRDVVARRPPPLPASPPELVVVEAPLRLNLTAAGEGVVLVSDRALKVHWLLRPFHELQLAQALYGEFLRPRLAAREPADDYWWLSEGLSRVLAARFVAQARPGTRSVHDWIELFNIFAIVDRFESVPKIPFVDAFFERARVADALHGEIATFNSWLPPGRTILNKLREVVGPKEFDELIDRCLTAPEPFRRCMAAERDLDWVLAQWLQPYPELDYRIDAVGLNQPRTNGFRHSITIRREASRPITEPVALRLRSVGGREVDLRWDGQGNVGVLSVDTSQRVCQAVIDPDRKLIEDRRDNNAQPPTPQVVLDTAEVEISSTEFGISGLVVGRGRYDYRKDLAVAGFYTNRSIGLTAGGRWHWGLPIDSTSYRHNLYVFYGVQALNGSFADTRRPAFRTPGQLAALGVRYDYSNVFSYDNPTDERVLRLYADWYDRGLGGSYDYLDWGFRLVGTHPLWGYHLIGAAEILNGFSEPLGTSIVPNQGLYSLGGSRSIRGIGAEDELGRNIFLVRTEVRHDVYPEVDFNLLDLLVVRRGEFRFFADSGRVSNAAGRVYDVSGYAVGVGAGVAAVYDFLGFFPSVAYIEIATRVDDARKSGDVQFLFGTRQAF